MTYRIASMPVIDGVPHGRAQPQILALGLLLVFNACTLSRTPDLGTHVVQPGDTLSQIAAEHGTTVPALIDLNRGQYPRIAESNGALVVAGWVLAVPGRAQRSTRSELTGAVASAPALPASPAQNDADLAAAVIALTNDERVRAGLPALAVDDGLMAIAQKRAMEISTDYSHSGLDDDCAECGENILQGPRATTAARMLERWMTSDGHRANILRDGVTRIGAAVYRTPEGVVFAVQVFAY